MNQDREISEIIWSNPEMLRDVPRVTQRRAGVRTHKFCIWASFHFPAFVSWAWVWKDGELDWSSLTGRQDKENITGGRDWHR